jgi:cold shock CspA family protein
MKGTIGRWFDNRGFGFINVEGQPNDIFIHVSDMKGSSTPQVGDEVEFNVRDTDRGPRAADVEIV